ncbi:hypothetical protein Tco_1496089, partial [Tanacetum coccineum]
NVEMEPDIKNITMNEYLEYEARMRYDIVKDTIWELNDDSEEDQEDDGDTFDM